MYVTNQHDDTVHVIDTINEDIPNIPPPPLDE